MLQDIKHVAMDCPAILPKQVVFLYEGISLPDASARTCAWKLMIFFAGFERKV
jgi:hypothetical protein